MKTLSNRNCFAKSFDIGIHQFGAEKTRPKLIHMELCELIDIKIY